MEKIIAGYFAAAAYMGFILGLGVVLEKVFKLEKELSRKIVHILSFGEFLICYFLFGPTIHLFIFNAVGAVALVPYIIIKSKKSGDKSEYGIMYLGISTALTLIPVVFVDAQLYLYNGIAYFCLALGDGLAPIFARLAKKFNTPIFKKKSLVGSLTVFIISALVTYVFGYIFDAGFDAMFILSMGALAFMAEVFGEHGLDNLWVEFAVFGFGVMHFYGLVDLALEIALLLSPPMLILTAKTGAFVPSANVASYFYFILSSFFMGMAACITIFVCYSVEMIVGKVADRIYDRKHPEEQKHEKRPRNAVQIFANSAVSLIFFILYYFLQNPVMLFCGFTAFAEEISDSLASDIGKLSDACPIDILKFKRTKSGLSGGITFIGTVAAALGALFASAMPFSFYPFDWRFFLIMSALAIAGMFVDSVFGSWLQALYRCETCDELVESTEHCGGGAVKIKGLSFVDNSMVNLLSNIVTGGIAMLVFFLI